MKGLFAQVEGEISLEQQNLIDEIALGGEGIMKIELPNTSWKDGQQEANSCLSRNVWSKEELKEGLQEVKGSGLSEDVGRYIGFGRKEFSRNENRVY